MAGTFYGRVDCVSNTAAASGVLQEQFTNCFQFFQHLASSSYAQLIALNSGSYQSAKRTSSGQIAGTTGFNYHDQAYPFSENSWAVFKMPSGTLADGSTSARAVDIYVLFQWAYNNSFNYPAVANQGGGFPGSINGNTGLSGLAMQVIWRDDGKNPWNGSTNADGSDIKGSPVWTAVTGGITTLRTLPRSNTTGGSYVTTVENCAAFAFYSPSAGSNYRYHFIADRDNFFFFEDDTDNNSYDQFMAWGLVNPIQGITTGSAGNAPMCMYMIADALTDTLASKFIVANTYGSTVGNNSFEGGLVGVQSRMTAPVRGCRTDRYSNNILSNTSLEPNPEFVSASFDLCRIPVMLFESPDFGLVGFLDNIYETFNANANTVNSSSTLAIFGVPGQVQIVVPWSGSSPGTNTTRRGNQY